VPRFARWLSRCTRRGRPCRNGSTCRQAPAAHDELTIGPLWVRICGLVGQRGLGWLTLAMVYGGMAICPPRALAMQDQRAILALSVNLIDKGDMLVMLREGDVLARVSDLEQAGLHGLAGHHEIVGGDPYVSLASLAPMITYELDETTLMLRLTASPALLSPTVVNLRTDRPPGITYSQNPSAFLNYALNWSDFTRVDGFGEVGLSLAGHLLASSFSRTVDGAFIRHFTSLTLDERERLRRWVIGDHFVGTGILGGSASSVVSVSRGSSVSIPIFSGTQPWGSPAPCSPHPRWTSTSIASWCAGSHCRPGRSRSKTCRCSRAAASRAWSSGMPLGASRRSPGRTILTFPLVIRSAHPSGLAAERP
jgi:hypothetical protein